MGGTVILVREEDAATARRLIEEYRRLRPDSRKQMELGTIEITKAVTDNAVAEHQMLFLPGVVPPGFEAEDPDD